MLTAPTPNAVAISLPHEKITTTSLKLRARSNGENWKSVFTCLCPVQMRRAKRAKSTWQGQRTKKQDGLFGQQSLWTCLLNASRLLVMPLLPRLFLNADPWPWLLDPQCHPSQQEPSPSCHWQQFLMKAQSIRLCFGLLRNMLDSSFSPGFTFHSI